MSEPVTGGQSIAEQSIAETEAQYTSGAYGKRPLTIVRGQGVTVYDDAGNSYLDMTSGMGVAVLGHSHPALVSAIQEQAATLLTCAEAFYNDQRAGFYQALAAITPDDVNHFFLCNSGAEAIEGAIKAAQIFSGHTEIIACKRGFHGRTLGALGLTWNTHYREPFADWTAHEHITHVSYNDLDSLAEAITENTAAVVVEAVQGEGGVYPAEPDYLRGVRALCDEHGVLMIVDEIQTGMGRTGEWFAFQHADIVPDIFTLAKGVAGGVPMGVVCWRDALGTLPSGTHGSTFGGNPLSCAAGIATIDTLQAEGVPQRCAELGAWFREQIEALDLRQVREVRQVGLMIGIELRGRVTPALKDLQERGVIALPAGKTVLRLLPPLIVTQDELQTVINHIAEVLS